MSMRKMYGTTFAWTGNQADIGVPNKAKETRQDERMQGGKTGAVFAGIG
jgi:hypothetical protein